MRSEAAAMLPLEWVHLSAPTVTTDLVRFARLELGAKVGNGGGALPALCGGDPPSAPGIGGNAPPVCSPIVLSADSAAYGVSYHGVWL